jgi:N utilization substance protein B
MARTGSKGVRRRASRLAAVQALYQMEIANKSVAVAIADFRDRRLNGLVEGEDVVTPENIDEELFIDIVEGVGAASERYDGLIDGALKKERGVDRIEVLLRLILRAGAYELTDRPDIDAPLSINEYVAVSQAFFGGTEPNFVNGVLDRMARELRLAENADDGKG